MHFSPLLFSLKHSLKQKSANSLELVEKPKMNSGGYFWLGWGGWTCGQIQMILDSPHQRRAEFAPRSWADILEVDDDDLGPWEAMNTEGTQR